MVVFQSLVFSEMKARQSASMVLLVGAAHGVERRRWTLRCSRERRGCCVQGRGRDAVVRWGQNAEPKSMKLGFINSTDNAAVLL